MNSKQSIMVVRENASSMAPAAGSDNDPNSVPLPVNQ